MKKAVPFLLLAFLAAPLATLHPKAPLSYAAQASTALEAGTPNGEGNLDAAASSLTAHSMDGPNGATVSFAYIGQKLFYAFHLPDSTHYAGKERLAFSASFGTYSHNVQGHLDGWMTASLSQYDVAYDEVNLAYDVVIGVNTGIDIVPGTAVAFSITYQDAQTADTSWGGGVANTLSLTLTVPTDETPVIPEAKGTNHLMELDSDWDGVASYPLSGPNDGTLRLATIGTRLFFRLDVADATHYPGKDKISYELTYAGKHHGQQGNFDPWLTNLGTMDFGTAVQTKLGYVEESSAYYCALGIDLGSDYVGGTSFSISLSFVDVTDASAGWGEGTANSVSLTLNLPKNGLERWTEAMLALPCDGTGATILPTSAWSEVRAIADAMDGLQRAPLSTMESSQVGTDLEQALARYDYVIGKYNSLSTTVYADYLHRVEGGKVILRSQTGPSYFTQENDPSFVWVILPLALGLGAGGVLFAYKKKKKN